MRRTAGSGQRSEIREPTQNPYPSRLSDCCGGTGRPFYIAESTRRVRGRETAPTEAEYECGTVHCPPPTVHHKMKSKRW